MVEVRTYDRMQKLIAAFLQKYPTGTVPKPEVPKFCIFAGEIYLVADYNITIDDIHTNKFKGDVDRLNYQMWRVGDVTVRVGKDDAAPRVAVCLQWLQRFLNSSAPHHTDTAWEVIEA